MDTPLDWFFDEIFPHSLRKPIEHCHPLDTSFLVWGGFFPPPTRIEMAMAPLTTTSLKSLEEHLFLSKDFTHIVGNILKVFQLATTEKEAIEEVL